MRPNEEFFHLLNLRDTYVLTTNDVTSWFKFDAATSSTDQVGKNTVFASGSFSRAWDFGSMSSPAIYYNLYPKWKSNLYGTYSGVYSYNHFGGLSFTSSLSETQSCTWMVSRINSSNGGDTIQLIMRNTYTTALIQHSNSSISSSRLGNSTDYKYTVPTSNNTMYISSLRGTQLRVNGSVGSVGGPVTSTSSGQSEIYFYTYGSGRGTASVFEVIHIDGYVNDSLFNYVENYLKTKWGISY